MASKRHIRRKACTGKVRHETEAFALIARRKTNPGLVGSMGVYRCDFCGGFHVGHRSVKRPGRSVRGRVAVYGGAR